MFIFKLIKGLVSTITLCAPRVLTSSFIQPYCRLHFYLFCFTEPGSTGTSLTLHRKCDLKFELVNNYLKKKGSDLCVQSNSRRDDPANNEEIVLDGDCDSKRHEFHFVFVDGKTLLWILYANSLPHPILLGDDYKADC